MFKPMMCREDLQLNFPGKKACCMLCKHATHWCLCCIYILWTKQGKPWQTAWSGALQEKAQQNASSFLPRLLRRASRSVPTVLNWAFCTAMFTSTLILSGHKQHFTVTLQHLEYEESWLVWNSRMYHNKQMPDLHAFLLKLSQRLKQAW